MPYSKRCQARARILLRYFDTITTRIASTSISPDASAIQITCFFLIVKERQPILPYRSDWLNRQCQTLVPEFLALKIGGGRRDRTDDPLLAKQVLSQLSYAPFPTPPRDRQTMVGLVGFEPTTPALSRRCSNQLSYRPLSLS